MAANKHQARIISDSLWYDGSGSTAMAGYARPSEIPLVPDNINRGLTFYTKISGTWDGWNAGISDSYQSESNRSSGTWWQPHGYQYAWPARPLGAFFTRVVAFNDEVTRFGLMGSLVGGYISDAVTHDQVNDNAVSYEAVYGHAAPPSWPIACKDQAKTQFRDASALPSDGASRILLTGSAWNRSAYLHPVYYAAHIVQGGTVASGTASFFLEQRPSWRMTQQGSYGTHGAYSSADFSGWFPDIPNLYDRLTVAWAWIYGYTLGNPVVYSKVAGVDQYPDTSEAYAVCPNLRSTDQRRRQTAVFSLNEEYYGVVWGSLLAIYSNKMSFQPLYVYDFALTLWTGTYKRIAGVATEGLNVWVLSENGDLALVDFSVSGGQVTAKTPAPALSGEERYGAIARIGTKLWALVGTHSTTMALSSTSVVGMISFDTVAGTWGARSNSPIAARHNTRTLSELIPLADGRLAALVEDAVDNPQSVVAIAPVGAAKSYYTNNGSFPEGRTIISKLPGSSVRVQGKLTRIKVGFAAAFGKIQATLKWVPKGSPVGTTFTGSVQCLFGGLTEGTLSNSTTWAAANLTSDWITVDWDPTTYDYYVYAYLPDGTYSASTYYTPFDNDLSTFRGPDGVTCSWATGDQQSATVSPATSVAGIGILWSIDSDPGDTLIGTYNAGTITNAAAWQVLVFNPTGSVWNTNKVTTAAFNTAPRTGLTTFEALFNTAFFAEVAPNKLLVQANWRNTKTFVVNVAGTLDATAILDVSWGTGTTIYDTGMNPSWPLITFHKNVVDGSVAAFAHTYTGSYQRWGESGNLVSFAHPGFAWDGTSKLKVLGVNGYTSGNVTTIAKDALYPTDVGTFSDASTIYGYFREWAFPTHFADNQLTVLYMGSKDTTCVQSNRMAHGVYYLPRYWKWSGGAWVVAKDWADAAASPRLIPSTPDTPVSGPHGLQLSFGPNANTTFQTGEFHTINVAYGQVKFARRTRWDFTMFAGRTFHHKETRTVAELGTLGFRWLPLSADTPVTTSGPTGITNSPAHTRAFIWPVMNGTTPNDAPLVAVYDLTKVPTSVPVWNSPFTQTRTTGLSAWDKYSSTDESWCIDYGAGNGKVIKAYVLHRCGYSDTRAWGKWLFQGSNDASTSPTNWTTLDTVTSWTWPNANGTYGWAVRDVASNVTAYRHYRVVMQAETSGKMRWTDPWLYDAPLGDANFADLAFINPWSGHPPFVYGLKFEVNSNAGPDTAGFTEITPKHRGHNGTFYCFDRQTGVKQLRITCKQGAWYSATQRYLPQLALWDYASQAVMDQLRLGSAGAANNTRERGAHDPECLGVATDSMAIWVDNSSLAMWTPNQTSNASAALGWFGYADPVGAGKFQVHPFYGFVRLPPATPGTTVTMSYAWGRRV